MSGFWWCCKTCGQEMYDSPAVYRHRTATGHVGAGLVSDDVPRPARSTPSARAAALAACRDSIAAARRRCYPADREAAL